MRIYRPEDVSKTKVIVVEHGDKQCAFDLSGYSRLGDVNEIFHDINNYWKWREETGATEELDKIFGAYKMIYEAVNTIRDQNHSHKVACEGVSIISKAMPVSLVRSWMEGARGEYRSFIRHPEDLKTQYDERDKREQTYLKDDYLEHAAFTIVLKFMMPVWSEYLIVLKDVLEIRRELICLTLLEQSTLINEPAYTRLKTFAECIADNFKISAAGIMNAGLSAAILPDFLFANGLINKVAIATLSHDDDDEYRNGSRMTINLIANLFNHLDNKPRQIENKRGNRVREKILNDDTKGSEDDNLSIAEQHKPKTALNERVTASFDYYMEDIIERAKRVKPDIDLDHLTEMVKLNRGMEYLALSQEQLEIIGLVTYRSGLSPRAASYINRDGLISLLSIAQVVMYENGFATIAELLSASRKEIASQLSTRSVMNDTHRKLLEEQYFYSRMSPDSSGKLVKRTPGEEAINEISTTFIPYYWETYVSSRIKEESKLIHSDNGARCPREFRNIVTEFIIKLKQNGAKS